MVDLPSECRRFVLSPSYSDLTLRQLALICVLADEEGPHHVRHLAQSLKVAKPVVTRAINRLEQDGLVCRAINPGDRRDRFVSLTDAGRALRMSLVTENALLETAIAQAIESAIGDGADMQDICKHRLAYKYLREALAALATPPATDAPSSGEPDTWMLAQSVDDEPASVAEGRDHA